MFVVTNPTLAVILCLVTMLCWGSWNNGQKLVTEVAPLSVFYRDYVYGIVGLALILAFTLGSLGSEGRSFLDDLQQATAKSILLALAGGLVFNVGNSLLTVGVNLSGITIAMPVGTGLSLAIGLVVNYLVESKGSVTLLAIGGASVLAAIAFSSLAYKAKEENSDSQGNNKGIWVALAGGLVAGFFFVIVSSSITKKLTQPEAGLLTPYTALLLFSLAILISNPLKDWALRRFGLLDTDNQTPYAEVLVRQHLIGLASGLLWCVGMISLLLGSPDAGNAVSYGLSQGATIISVLWGLFLWGEFKGAPAKADRYLWLMGVAYIAGLVLIVLARSQS